MDCKNSDAILSADEDAPDHAQEADHNKLRLALEAKDRFLMMMSHEFRTPLNGIIGATEILQDPNYDRDAAITCEMLSIINQAGWTLTAVLNAVLEYADYQLDEPEQKATNVMLRPFIAPIICDLKHRAKSEDIRMSYQEVLCCDWGRFNPDTVGQGIRSIVQNAILHSRCSDINISVVRTIDTLLVSVHDDGVGMTDIELAIARQPFRQIREGHNRPTGGVGLGIPLTERTCMSHGGRMDMDNSEGQGLKVTLRFPQ